MSFKLFFLVFSVFTVTYGCNYQSKTAEGKQELSAEQDLGKRLFFDLSLSEPVGQACSSCHTPEAAFSPPQLSPLTPVTQGAHRGLFGNRNTPSIQYATYIPPRRFDKEEGVFVGGLFLDGRVNNLESQATGPVFNPVEMAVSSPDEFYKKLQKGHYKEAFQAVYGTDAFIDSKIATSNFARAIATYQRSRELSPFNSKYDAYLQGKVNLTEQEMNGLKIFEDEDKGNCAACHPNKPTDKNPQPILTDFTYDNLGVPANPQNPFYTQSIKFNPAGKSYVDQGLGTIVQDIKQNGKFRVPTLRNIEKTAPYMHNGVFDTLEEVVDFYNTRDTKKWPKPEVELNKNTDELGDLKLTQQESDDLIAFLKTLTDGYTIK